MSNGTSIPNSFANLKRPLEQTDLALFHGAMEKLQGNILKGHGRRYTSNILLRFAEGRQYEAKKWLSEFARSDITSAQQQLEHKRPADPVDPGEPFACVSLSVFGYQYLGYQLSPVFDRAFVFGMKQARITLNDTDSACWEPHYQGTIHALVILADSSHDRLEKRTKRVQTNLGDQVLAVESGEAIRDEKRPNVAFEHFGYLDGASQPAFFSDDVTGQPVDQWNPTAGPGLAVVADPLSSESDAFGSYLVFRKLEQRVGEFIRHNRELASAIKADEDHAGAHEIGRLRSGTPLVVEGVASTKLGESLNNFNYGQDERGTRCPLGAHIRKVNPRGTGLPIEVEQTHRITRRGIPYGKPVAPGEEPVGAADRGRGLLFMCYQRSIKAQFEVIQGQWANTRNFPVLGAGVDPIIGQPQPPQGCADPQTSRDRSSLNLPPFVALMGGEYFFTPSKSFLQTLTT